MSGYSEETCVRCGWTMGQPPLNCQNDDTPHRFPSSEAENQRYEKALRSLHNEVDCRIEHGAESGGHLEYVRGKLGKAVAGDEE